MCWSVAVKNVHLQCLFYININHYNVYFIRQFMGASDRKWHGFDLYEADAGVDGEALTCIELMQACMAV